jgi:hypothetical protein
MLVIVKNIHTPVPEKCDNQKKDLSTRFTFISSLGDSNTLFMKLILKFVCNF